MNTTENRAEHSSWLNEVARQALKNIRDQYENESGRQWGDLYDFRAKGVKKAYDLIMSNPEITLVELEQYKNWPDERPVPLSGIPAKEDGFDKGIGIMKRELASLRGY